MLDEKSQVDSMPEKKPHANAGRKQSPEHIAKRVVAKTGVPLSEEHKAKLAAVPHSAERREKNRQARLKQKNLPDTKAGARKWWAELRADPVRYEAYIQKLRNKKIWNKGIACREETKQKLSAKNKGKSNVALIGKPRPQWLREKLATLRRGTKLTDEHKAAISRAHKGRKGNPEHYNRGPDHHNWGKPAPVGSGHSKGSYCKKGHYVRSTWELACADWFFDRNIEYTYEATLFDLGDGIRYRPDFYIPSMDLYVEVKGYYLEKDRIKHSRFMRSGHKLYVFDKAEFQLFQLTGWLNLPYLEQLAS
jgi:hypothetical protein